MASISKSFKNDQITVELAKRLAHFYYAEDAVPPIEEHEAAIQSWLDGIIDPIINSILIDTVVLKDPDVAAKKAEYDALVRQKSDDAGVVGAIIADASIGSIIEVKP